MTTLKNQIKRIEEFLKHAQNHFFCVNNGTLTVDTKDRLTNFSRDIIHTTTLNDLQIATVSKSNQQPEVGFYL